MYIHFLIFLKMKLDCEFVGEGTLKNRDNARMLGTDKEHLLLNPEDP